MLLDWDPSSRGERLVTSCSSYLDVWEFKKPVRNRMYGNPRLVEYSL